MNSLIKTLLLELKDQDGLVMNTFASLSDCAKYLGTLEVHTITFKRKKREQKRKREGGEWVPKLTTMITATTTIPPHSWGIHHSLNSTFEEDSECGNALQSHHYHLHNHQHRHTAAPTAFQWQRMLEVHPIVRYGQTLQANKRFH